MRTWPKTVVVLLLAGAGPVPALAQLAITEVMAESSDDLMPTFKGPDFWELTNFGTNAVNLHGYGFRDNSPANFYTYPFDNLILGAGKSVVFVRTNAAFPSTNNFRDWWGETSLPPDLEIRAYARPGFDGDVGDEVWLFDTDTARVAMVAFDKSSRGRSFTYDPDTGEFGRFSAAGVNLAFRAQANTNDIGSPGWTTGSVPLSILVPPTSQTVDGCSDVRFNVVVTGVPEPRYQWTSNSIPINGATGPTLVVAELDSSATVEYRVVLNNSLMETTSPPAVLRLDTSPAPPYLVHALSDVSVFPGQTAVFAVQGRGYPCPQFQWLSNGVAIPGATQPTYAIQVAADASPFSAQYTVTLSNDLGSTNAAASLLVTRRACLRVTEIMSGPTNGSTLGHKNWFELTNCDTNAVELQNYRFRDSQFLSVAAKITNRVVIQPGESMIFVEAMSPQQFRQWWGPERLPPGLQIITWGGWALSELGNDAIYVWNPGATTALDTVATASHLATLPGVSQELENFCDSIDGCIGFYQRDSAAGERGAFRAAEGRDIGSPGYATFPRVLGISKNGTTVSVLCLVEPGKFYRLLSKDDLPGVAWTSIANAPAGGSWEITILDPTASGVGQRFYRLEELP